MYDKSIIQKAKKEIVMDAECAAKTVDAVRRVHPYEEPVIHLIPLLDLEAL